MDRKVHKLLSEVLFTEMPGSFSTECVWQPPTDVFETKDSYILRMEIAGVKRDDLHIDMSQNVLTITGCRAEPSPHGKVAPRRLEICYGPFKRCVSLPGQVDGDIRAAYDNGFLELVLPKTPTKRVSINVDSDD